MNLSIPASTNESYRRLQYLIAPDREQETMSAISQRLADGESLMEISRAWLVSRGQLLAWIMSDAKRYALYKRALEVWAHCLVSETVDIADNSGIDIPKAKLRIDTRFRLAKHHAKELYGDDTVDGQDKQSNITIVIGETVK